MNRQQLEKLNRDCIYEVYEDREETNEFYMGYIKAIFKKYIIIEVVSLMVLLLSPMKTFLKFKKAPNIWSPIKM
ncbi:TPA: hypothetical protein ACSY45_01045 [Listeria monocytogenes]